MLREYPIQRWFHKRLSPPPAIIACCLMLLLAACSPLTTQQQGSNRLATAPDYWINRGKIAVQIINPQPSQSARQVLSFRCKQSPDNFLLELSGTLGFGRVSIEENSDGALIRRGDKVLSRAATLDALLISQVGLDLPVDQLKNWVLGLPQSSALLQPPSGSNSDAASAAIPTINGFIEGGWEINYPQATVINGYILPTKILAKNDALALKIAIKDWQLSEIAIEGK